MAARLRKEVPYLLDPKLYPALPLPLIPLATLRAYRRRVKRKTRIHVRRGGRA